MIGSFSTLTLGFWILAQDDGSGGSSGFPIDLSVFGVAGATIAILLYACRTLWQDNKELRGENNTIQQVAIERVSDISAKSSQQLMESAKTLEAATVMMHQLAGRPGLSPENLAELLYHMRALRELRERSPDARTRRDDVT